MRAHRHVRPLAGPVLFLAIALAGCAGIETAPRDPGRHEPVGGWSHSLDREHELTGRIYARAEDRFISRTELEDRLAATDFVLLGERHDNLDHHRLQAELVAALGSRGRRPAVVFEMIEEPQRAALQGHLERAPGDAAGLGAALGWDRTGWPDWDANYRQVAAAALRFGLPLADGNIPRGEARDAARTGPAGLDPARSARLGLGQPLPSGMQAEMEQEIAVAHCNALPARFLPSMALVQRARDAQMALRMVETGGAAAARPGDGAILIAGAGHVRSDRGVPWHLRTAHRVQSVASVAFREAGPGLTRDALRAQPFDYLWVSPRVDDKDPCAGFSMRRLGAQRATERPSSRNFGSSGLPSPATG